MKNLLRLLKKETGFSIVEVTIAAGLMAAGALAMMTMQESSMKGVNQVEFKLKREQLKTAITSQFLSNPDNCKCLFAGVSEFDANIPNANQAITLSGVNPSQIGRYFFTTAGNCTGATILNPILKVGSAIDGVTATNISITNVTGFNNLYSGDLTIDLETDKKMMGSTRMGLKVPVSISTVAGSPGKAKFANCSAKNISGDKKIGFSFDPADGVGSSVPARSTSLISFDRVPPTAKAVMVAYTIGSPSSSRGDRRCVISGGQTNIILGTDSKGDGGQKQVGGTAFLPLNPCGAGLSMTCNNSGGRGNFTVIAVVDDGESNCATAGPLCDPGYIYDAEAAACFDASGSIAPTACVNPSEVYINGVCTTPPASGGGGVAPDPVPDREPPTTNNGFERERSLPQNN